ncbi:MAG: glucose-1-phosphate cytidylyltransferase [Candidatus Omnitrophica bacterium]|nr:glucose-1-phosphate cytidylyltransferase [Candidatus Omnitrophota bacterium]
MQAVILAGGMGTRFSEETAHRPKPMIPVGGRPILWHIMNHYASFGHTDFLLCLGYKSEVIRDYFLNYRMHHTDLEVELGTGKAAPIGSLPAESDWKVILADTGLNTATGGRLKRIAKYIRGDTFLATYGDSLSDVPIDQVVDFHRQKGRIGTLCVMRSAQRFGVVWFQDGKVTRFQEKPAAGEEWINGGFYVFDRRIFDYLDEDCTLEEGPLNRLAAEGQLAAYSHSGCHRAMDTWRDLQLLEAEWSSGHPPWVKQEVKRTCAS